MRGSPRAFRWKSHPVSWSRERFRERSIYFDVSRVRERNQFAERIGRSSRKKQLATANLTWCRARVGGFVDALPVCCAGSRAQVEHNFIDVLRLFPVSASAFPSE